MQFKIEEQRFYKTPSTDEFKLAKDFAEKIQKELQHFVKAIVLFGSSTDDAVHGNDIDVLLVIDDLTKILNDEVVTAYRIIVDKTASAISKRFHINTIKLTHFWEYIRHGDPIMVNMLRSGVPLYDTGFFEPMQALLHKGKIRPTKESVMNYYARAPLTLKNASWHVMQGALDLYWAVIDAAHAALMHHGEVPPSPSHAADLLDRVLVKEGKLEKKYVGIMKEFYQLSRDITHHDIGEFSGADFDAYQHKAHDFVKRIKKLLANK
jgi:uncharacterized protein (UPF0332 family)/predicted nucleotidyltransferase